MRKVVWEDNHGYKHVSLIRDRDPDSAAPQGIPLDPPDVHDLDLGAILRDLHNGLIDRGITSFDDLQGQPDLLTGLATSVLRRHLTLLLRNHNAGARENLKEE